MGLRTVSVCHQTRDNFLTRMQNELATGSGNELPRPLPLSAPIASVSWSGGRANFSGVLRFRPTFFWVNDVISVCSETFLEFYSSLWDFRLQYRRTSPGLRQFWSRRRPPTSRVVSSLITILLCQRRVDAERPDRWYDETWMKGTVYGERVCSFCQLPCESDFGPVFPPLSERFTGLRKSPQSLTFGVNDVRT